MDLLSIAWNNFRQTPRFDRVFYAPFWECPFLCDFCCVDSLPGRPPEQPDDGEVMLDALVDAFATRHGAPVQVHVYGGEPLLRRDYVVALAQRLAARPAFRKLYLYTTLRMDVADAVLEALGPTRLRVVVNRDTLDERAAARMAALGPVDEFYTNVTVFPTGRGRPGAPGYKRSLLERVVPTVSLPGRSCFATVSGPLVNGAHGTVHLCCLPQSPVVGVFDEPVARVLARYEATLATFHHAAAAAAKARGLSHACAVCEAQSRWDTRVRPDTTHLVEAGAVELK